MTDNIYADSVDLYQDLVDCQWIKDKIRASDKYAQNMYAAMCNVVWYKQLLIPALRGANTWTTTWRTSGGIISAIRGGGDYMDWYCSGIAPDQDDTFNNTINGSVPEGTITIEIAEDLKKLGWTGEKR